MTEERKAAQSETDRLERIINAQQLLLEEMAKQVGKLWLRLLALEGVLETKRLITPAEHQAKIRAIEDLSTLELEYGPEYEEFRRFRKRVEDAIREGGESQEHDQTQE